jgi:hypothetical protein
VREFTYKFIKSSWGIYISIKADWSYLSAYGRPSVKISEKLFFAAEAPYLIEVQLKYLHLGLSLLADEFDEKFKHREPVVVILKAVDFNPLDYQDEGLAAALMCWMSEEFEIPIAPLEIKFDRANNRYLFNFETETKQNL